MAAREVTAFTLVEMLVSIVVLTILILVLSQLFNGATAAATLSRKHLDADEAARLVFDRMGNDFAHMVRRPDVNYIFYKSTTGASTSGSSDAMFFYSEAPGYLDPAAALASGSASSMALVGYRINSNNPYYPNTPVIERLGENLTWGGLPDLTGTIPGGMAFLPSTLAANWSYTLGTPPYVPLTSADTNASKDTEHYQVLSDMVFRMEFCFMLRSGTYSISGTSAVSGSTGYCNAPTAIPATVPQPYVTASYFLGGASPDLAGNVYGFPPDLAAVVVTIAVLDNGSRKLLGSGRLSTLAGTLPDSLSGDTTGSVQANPRAGVTAQAWQSQLLKSGFAQSAGIPLAALAQVRVYERTFYLDAN